MADAAENEAEDLFSDAAVDEHDDYSTDPNVPPRPTVLAGIPDEQDIWEFPPDRIARMEQNQNTTIGARVKVKRLQQNGRYQTLSGWWPIEQACSIQWLEATCGPGTYQVQLLDPHTSRFIVSATHTVGQSGAAPHSYSQPYGYQGQNNNNAMNGAPWGPPNGFHPPMPPNGAQPYHYPSPYYYPPPQPQPSARSDRDLFGGMIKMMQLQMTYDRMAMERQQRARDEERKDREEYERRRGGANGSADNEFIRDLFKTMLPLVVKQNGSGSANEALAFLRVGLEISKKNAGDIDGELWTGLAESVGPPVVGAIVGGLYPKDRAKPILDMITEHMKRNGGGPDFFDTDGESETT